jgi:catechol 2,3-dioxygenase-like lactoylglutathione lyase family enzyme
MVGSKAGLPGAAQPECRHDMQTEEMPTMWPKRSPRPAARLEHSPDKFLGYTHIALRVASIPATIGALRADHIAITQGPVSFGKSGQVSVFVRDPDSNVIELRGREQGVVEGVARYVP